MERTEYQNFFSELAAYEGKGVDLVLEGKPASPLQITNAHFVKEDVGYMRDYVLNEEGDVKRLCFDDVRQ